MNNDACHELRIINLHFGTRTPNCSNKMLQSEVLNFTHDRTAKRSPSHPLTTKLFAKGLYRNPNQYINYAF